MVIRGVFPLFLVMATFTLVTKLAFVLVIFLVASDADTFQFCLVDRPLL